MPLFNLFILDPPPLFTCLFVFIGSLLNYFLHICIFELIHSSTVLTLKLSQITMAAGVLPHNAHKLKARRVIWNSPDIVVVSAPAFHIFTAKKFLPHIFLLTDFF